MLKLCNIDIKHSKEIYRKLKEFITKLKKNFVVDKVYLFGSFANEEFHEGSDIDLIIIGDFKGKMFHRIAEVLKLTDLPVEPLVYTNEEFARLKKTSSFIKEVLKKAKEI